MAHERAGEVVLPVAIGQPQLHLRLLLDSVGDTSDIMIEPCSTLGLAIPLGAGGYAVVGADDHQVRAVVAKLLVGLKSPARLDVEEAVDDQNGKVIDIPAHAALPPVRVQGGVAQAAVDPGVAEPLNRIEGRERVSRK